MGEYDGLELFSLKNHGDQRELELGPLIQEAFPAYEIFWCRYIVPLTNRIDPAIPPGTPEWIRLRPEVGDTLEWMAMCHYSVFYYLARARKHMRSDTSALFPEDVFALLDTCRENVLFFFESIVRIFGDFSPAAPQLPRQQQFLCSSEDRPKPERDRGGFVRAQKYRNVMIHNPVLGRAVDKTGEMLPHWMTLEKVGRSWRASEKLGPNEWINARDLFEGLYRDITGFLQHEWQSIIDAMEEIRYKPQHAPKFKKKWALQAFLPISKPKIRIRLDRTASHTLTSGTAISSTAVVPVPLAPVPPGQPDSELPSVESSGEREESK